MRYRSTWIVGHASDDAARGHSEYTDATWSGGIDFPSVRVHRDGHGVARESDWLLFRWAFVD